METRHRSIVKSGLWAVLGLVCMALVGFGFTGSWSAGGGMALANSGIGFVLYLVYERVWARIAWGRMDA